MIRLVPLRRTDTKSTTRTRRLVTPLVVAGLLLAGCGQSEEERQEEVNQKLDRALELQAAGQEDRARDVFQEVVELDPTNKYAVYNLALLDQLAGRSEEAEGKYRVVLELDSQYQPALYNLGVLLAQDGRTDEAVALYRRAVAVRPNAANAHFNLALLLRAQGKQEEGDAAMRQALSLDPKLKDPAASQSSSAPAPASTAQATPPA